MSAVFFQELGLPPPDYNLEVGSGPHGQQTGDILARMERVLVDEQPDWVLVRGDTNSTLAGALAAAKLHIPVGHIPRTRKQLTEMDWQPAPHVHLAEPQGYFDILVLEHNARLLLTDSGGMQKEAYCLGTPCLTLREQTEWVETVEAGWNHLVGTDTDRIIDAVRNVRQPAERPTLYGDGRTSEAILAILETRSFGE